jgi:hypothetical protein
MILLPARRDGYSRGWSGDVWDSGELEPQILEPQILEPQILEPQIFRFRSASLKVTRFWEKAVILLRCGEMVWSKGESRRS